MADEIPRLDILDGWPPPEAQPRWYGAPAAETMLQEVRSIVALDPVRERRPPILRTEALRGDGVPELWEALESRRHDLGDGGIARPCGLSHEGRPGPGRSRGSWPCGCA